MKKFFLAIMASLMTVGATAHVITITLNDGTEKVLTSSQLKSIDIDGQKVTAVAWDGSEIEGIVGTEARAISMTDKAKIVEIIDRHLDFTYENIPLGNRDVKCINYVYPSVDPRGEAITLSGTILIPNNIYDGEAQSDGILWYNHYTIANKNEAPGKGTFSLETVLLGNLLKPNYIVVESDFYGFGVTERYPQAYLYGQANAKASVDALYAAREILDDMGIDGGKYLFNLGYSSGGFDSMATQKEVDNNHRGNIKIDKTYSGGGPCDLSVVYRDYVEVDAIKYLCAVPLMIVAFNESGQMGLDYNEVFQSPLADHVNDWILSKDYDTWTINGFIGEGTLVSQMLQPEYCDLEGEKAKSMMQLFDSMSNTTDWEPDPEDNFYLIHSRDDDYVTFGAARSMTDYLVSKGFEKSIIPGRTNFQTNLVVKKLGHILTMLVYCVQVAADIKAWPLIHATAESEAAYDALAKAELPVTQTLDYFNELGLNANDVIYVVQQFLAKIQEGGGEIPAIDPTVVFNGLLEKLGVTPQELLEMSDDSGLDLQKMLMDIAVWLKTHPGSLPGESEEGEGGETPEQIIRRVAAKDAPVNPVKAYEQQLMEYYRLTGVFEK